VLRERHSSRSLELSRSLPQFDIFRNGILTVDITGEYEKRMEWERQILERSRSLTLKERFLFLKMVRDEEKLRVKDPFRPDCPAAIALIDPLLVEPKSKLLDPELIEKIRTEAEQFADITDGKKLAMCLQISRYPNDNFEYWPIAVDDAITDYLRSFERS